MGNARTRVLFKLCSGTHGLNEKLGRHRGRAGKYMCNLCGEDCESVGHFLWNCLVYVERRALFFEHLKNSLGNKFEHFKSWDIAGKSHFILGTELWGSHYEELLHLVKSYIIDNGNCANQSCMALALVRCSIEADQGGTPHARAQVSLVSWEGRSHALLFMVLLGLPSARPMAQTLRLPFEYYIDHVTGTSGQITLKVSVKKGGKSQDIYIVNTTDFPMNNPTPTV